MRNSSIITIIVAAALACGKDAPTYGGPPIAEIVLTAPMSSVPVGQTLQFTTVVRDVNGDLVTTAALQWQSSATVVATVTQNGLLTARAAGTTRVSARSGAVKDSVEIIVTSNTFDVNTAGETFLPFSLTVPVGTTVHFNLTGEHDVQFAAVNGAPPNIPIVSNMTVLRTFNTIGTFPYVCEIHPGMAGQIVVQ